ncbi:unnamed protein product [Jaminaea pallidilutea]
MESSKTVSSGAPTAARVATTSMADSHQRGSLPEDTDPDHAVDDVVDENAPLMRPSSTSSSRKRHHRRSTFIARTSRPQAVLRVLLGLLTLLFIALLILVFLSPRSALPTPPLDSRGRLNPPNLIKGDKGGVASENRVCSEIGTDLLKKGGSAADAAIGATLCVGVLNMFSSGIGGGGFAIIRAPKNTSDARDDHREEAEHVVIDFREVAPAAAFEDMYHGAPEKARFGGLAIGVPGELRGLEEIWKRWGKLQWAELLEPSIALANEARVGKELARRLQIFGGFMPEAPEWADIFLDPETQKFLKAGDVIRRPAYARTLQAVAEGGADAFYHGRIAESIVAKVQSVGGILTVADLENYRIHTRDAIRGQWLDNRTAWTSPAPTSGPVLLEMMNLLRLLDFEDERRHDGSDKKLRALWAHRLVEVFKHGYGARTHVGDPDYLNASALHEIEQISTMERAREILPKINDSTTINDVNYYEPLFDSVEDHGTTHISVVDDDGMSVGITSTVNLIFGSQVLDPETGVILNDEMDDSSTPGAPNAFGLYPSPYNYPQPGKRPLSSISPLILEDENGRFELLLGAAGGSRIPTSVLSTLLNLERGMDLSDSIEAPRLHHQLLPAVVSVESTYDEYALQHGLQDRGHVTFVTDINLGFASVQGVQVKREKKQMRGGSKKWWWKKQVLASSDSRKTGWADAY